MGDELSVGFGLRILRREDVENLPAEFGNILGCSIPEDLPI
jgi:hypothetical protein